MKLPDFLTTDSYGYIHLTGHRIGMVDIVHFYRQGDNAEMLAARFPSVPLALHHKVIAHYPENQAEVDSYVLQHDAVVEQQRRSAASSGQGPSLDELRARMNSRKLTAGA